ncbi:hypothetical protein METBIDRAFT_11575 [Metschnikowia bicuspidata var. bicuspidata NRRL YB-4993]|uniref:Uncharacterized protein n=1 Tax=Metschnikowia bicuspidata var. bicuspidata NRRL YB-4993 TaxID=869754 RepID=A0A1A0HAS5_9ASCO|nr:hypothetical protein METBIDRAFT_11575 [Metschnikowia bicuspidata var. bicuspidata NRRL YB-4993]OBA20982.1 hypothetical protein METBIDRAFT_11575 [Metschnikowia bicuspidata var. bicuspidata NRRL YB-4993]
MNLEEKLTKSLSDILRTSGYVFEIINNNKRQSNLIAGPNNQLIPPPMMEQLAQKIASFELILDDTVAKFNDAPWCVDQIVQNKKKQDEQKIREDRERQQREEAERKRKIEEEALAQKRRAEAEKAARDKQRADQEHRDRLAREQEQREQTAKDSQKAQQHQNQQHQQTRQNAHNPNQQNQAQLLQQYTDHEGMADGPILQNELMDPSFDLDMDIPNPSDILSMNFKDDADPGMGAKEGNPPNTDNPNSDVNGMIKGSDSLLDDLNMDLLGEGFDEGPAGGEEEFDVENFLNQFGHGG